MITVNLSPCGTLLEVTDDFGSTLYLNKADTAELLDEIEEVVEYMQDKQEAQGNG